MSSSSSDQTPSDIPSGTWFFGTISLEHPVDASVGLLFYLKKIMPDYLAVTLEEGLNKKAHIHFLGLTKSRQDNIRRRIIKLLRDENNEVDDKYSVIVLIEPNPVWRLGYLMKEEGHIQHIMNFRESTIQEAKKLYGEKPKRERPDRRGNALSKDKVAQYCMDHGAKNRFDVVECLRAMADEGSISFSFFEKLNVKKLILWITRQMDDSQL